MKVKTPIFIILFFCCAIVFSQQSTTLQKKDSIQYFLKNASGKYQLRDLEKAVDLAEKLEIDSLIMVANVKFGLQSYLKKKTYGLDIAQQNLNKLYLKSKDSFALAKVFHYKALIHLLNFKKDSSLYYYIESKNISASIKDSLEVGRRLLSMSNIQRDGKDYLGSELSAIEGLQYLEPINDIRFTGNLYNSLGLSALRTNKNKEARRYFNSFLKINQQNPNKKRKYTGFFHFYNNSALSYIREKNYDKGIELFNKALKMDSLEFKSPKLYSLALDNLSSAYYSKGELTTVLNRLKLANKIKTRINNISGLSTNHNLQFSYYSKINDSKKALYHANKALEYAKESNFTRREAIILLQLANSNLINKKAANTYLQRYININDSIIEHEKTVKNQFARIRYETGKKEKENFTLKVENDKKQLEIEKEKQQKLISFLLAIGSLLILGISFLVFKNRRKKLAFETQLEKAEAREQERQQIAKSLHDEVAGDLRMLHQQLEKTNQVEVAKKLDVVKNNVRNLSHQLSSVRFNEVNFKDQIINLISDYFSLDCKIKVSGLNEFDWTNIESPIKRTLYLTLRESLQNANKYAKATQINIELNQTKNNVYLIIKDNGVGFDFSERANGIGLKNQKERIEEINGNIEIKSSIKEPLLKLKSPFMSKKLKILIADDHQILIDGIISSLKEIEEYDISSTTNCDDAFAKLKQEPFDILFTDLSFDNDTVSTKIDGGESLIKAIQKEEISVKIGVITGHSEINRIYNVIQNLKPSAYLLKTKCNATELNFAIQKMMSNDFYYTHEVHQKMIHRASINIQMDEVAIQILKELPSQSKINNLEGIIKKEDGTFLKLRSIESKLANLRIDLNAINNTDLILKAKELGIID